MSHYIIMMLFMNIEGSGVALQARAEPSCHVVEHSEIMKVTRVWCDDDSSIIPVAEQTARIYEWAAPAERRHWTVSLDSPTLSVEHNCSIYTVGTWGAYYYGLTAHCTPGRIFADGGEG